MKRSEMLNIIYKAFCKRVPYHDDGGTQLGWQVENVLKAIEQAGMLPPLQGKGVQPIPDDCEWESEEQERGAD